MHASTVAIDLAKEVFELAFADAQGRVIGRKAFARVLDQPPPLRVLPEARASASTRITSAGGRRPPEVRPDKTAGSCQKRSRSW